MPASAACNFFQVWPETGILANHSSGKFVRNERKNDRNKEWKNDTHSGFLTLDEWLYITMCDYIWPWCMTLYDPLWISMTLYQYLWLCLTMKDYLLVKLIHPVKMRVHSRKKAFRRFGCKNIIFRPQKVFKVFESSFSNWPNPNWATTKPTISHVWFDMEMTLPRPSTHHLPSTATQWQH